MNTPAAFLWGADVPAAVASAPTRPPEVVGTVVQDSASFSDFYREHWPGVARALALTLGDQDLATEAADEAMVRAYPRWEALQGYDNPAGWVYRVGLNWARSYRRRLTRLIPFTHHDAGALDAVSDPGIRRALMALDVKHRSVVVCRLFLDWSVDQTAAALDIAPGTVKSRLHRALQTLQPALSPER